MRTLLKTMYASLVIKDHLVKSDSISVFPEIQDFEMIAYAEPEHRFNVIMPNDDKIQVIICKKTYDYTKRSIKFNLAADWSLF